MMRSSWRQLEQRCEWIALLLLTACFFVSAVSVTLTTITYLSAFLFVLLSGDWHAKWGRIKNNKAAMSFWILGLLFIVGVFYSTSTKQLIWQDLHKNHWLFITPFLMMIITQESWRQRMINAFLWVMCITVCLSYIKWMSPVYMTHVLRLPKVHADHSIFSVFVNHIVQSFAMNLAAFICGYRFLYGKPWRIFYALMFVVMAINIIFMSDGRTGYGIFFLLLLYLSLIRFGWKGVVIAAFSSAILISIAFFTSIGFHSRTKAVYQHYQHYDQLHHKTSVGQRIEMVDIAKRMIHERPWFGYGTGGIRTALPLVVPEKYRLFNPSIDYVESIYLNFLLEFGVVGFVVLLIVLAMQIKVSFQLPQPHRALMQAVLLAILFGGVFNAFLVSFAIAHIYALFSAVCYSAYKEKV